MKSKKINASVLPTAVILSVVVCIIVMTLISFFDIGSKFSGQYISQWQRRSEIESAKLLYEKGLITILENDSTAVRLFQNDPQSDVMITRKAIGLYDDVTFTSSDQTIFLRLIMGMKNSYPYGLFYAENNYTLTLGGNTNIHCVASLPKAGVTYAKGDAINFCGKKNNNDSSMISSEMIEQPSIETISRIDAILSNPIEQNIELTSDDQLYDTMVVVEKIIIRSGFIGSLQIFATDSIVVEKEVKLKRGSGLYCKGYIEIADNATVDGYVISHRDNNPSDSVSLRISDRASIRGFVYCDDIAEVSGKIQGVALIQRARHHTDEGFYDNLIHNLTTENDPTIAIPQWTDINKAQTRVKLLKRPQLSK